MAADNMTHEKKPELIDIEKKDGLLEELDLPPKLIKAIRENMTAIQIIAVTIVILLFGWTYYDYYSTTKKSEASTALYLAVQETEEGRRLEAFSQVADDFSGTDAALWSKIEQGHLAFEGGDYSAALEKYNDVESEIASESPLKPVLYNSIGLSYENSGDTEKALDYYNRLEKLPGFKLPALLARGRILEQLGKTDEALKVYQEADLEKDLGNSERSFLAEKINYLQSSVQGE